MFVITDNEARKIEEGIEETFKLFEEFRSKAENESFDSDLALKAFGQANETFQKILAVLKMAETKSA